MTIENKKLTAASENLAKSGLSDIGQDRESEYMSAVDLSQGNIGKPAEMNQINDRLNNRKIIFETESIEISIKAEPFDVDSSTQSNEEEETGMIGDVDSTVVNNDDFIGAKREEWTTGSADSSILRTAPDEGVDRGTGNLSGGRGSCSDGLKDRSKTRLKDGQPRQILSRHFVCECGEAFVHGASLRIHRLQHTGEPRFSCEICGKIVTTGRSLENHRLTHAKASHPCPVCPKRFSTMNAQRRHRLEHETTARFACADCPAGFQRRSELREHANAEHAATARPHVCPTCGSAFARKGELEKHVKIHDGADRQRLHVCELCGKAFFQVGHLLSHRSVHSTDRPYRCDECPLAFSRNAFLTSHKRTHLSPAARPRPFACLVCPADFTRRCDLKKHALLHSGLRKHVCAVCGKAFSQSGHLASHNAVHTGERPHKCAKCGKTFKRKTALRRHQVAPHANDPCVECVECLPDAEVTSAKQTPSSDTNFKMQ